MDFILRCNSLKCRRELTEWAVVTTCSHVFCSQCSDSLGLRAASEGNRICPACQTTLNQPDDAASTCLQPTEDYKTSVLSGFNPSTIMECAGRGLAFWSYQSTQEIVYQEYLAKTLTDKYNTLNNQMDKVISDANSELNILNQKLNNMSIDMERLKSENTNLVAAYREKNRKHQQTQELYDRLKRKEMTAATRSAAFSSVDEVLGNVSNQQRSTGAQHNSSLPRSSAQPGFAPSHVDHNGMEQIQAPQRNSGTLKGGNNDMMLPPITRRTGLTHNGFGYANNVLTPTSHRTQLGPIPLSSGRQGPGSLGKSTMEKISPSRHRSHFTGSQNGNALRSNGTGYGMSAGMRVSRQ